MVTQSHMRKLSRVSVLRPASVSRYSVNIVKRDNSLAGPAWTERDSGIRNAADTVRYHAHFVKKSYTLLNAILLFYGFKPQVPDALSAVIEKELQSVLKETYGAVLPAHEDGTKNWRAPAQISSHE